MDELSENGSKLSKDEKGEKTCIASFVSTEPEGAIVVDIQTVVLESTVESPADGCVPGNVECKLDDAPVRVSTECESVSVSTENVESNTKPRRNKKLKTVSGTNEIVKANGQEEEPQSLPHKRPRTTPLSRSYRKQKKVQGEIKKDDRAAHSPMPHDGDIGDKQNETAQLSEVDIPCTPLNKVHSSTMDKDSTLTAESVVGKDEESFHDITRSRYGRPHKKRPMSPVTSELSITKEKKTQEKEDDPATTQSATPISTGSPVVPEKEIPCDWVVGDIVWARLSGYPWWPGLIGEDPLLKVFTKFKGGERTFRMYHVQFLGSAVLRGWLAAKSLMPFEGKEKYEEHKRKVYESAPSKARIRAKIMSAFEVKPSHQAAWLESVAEAEEALPLSREERQLKHGVDYFTDSSEDDRRRSKSRSSTSRGRQNRSRLSSTSSTHKEKHSSKNLEASSSGESQSSDESDVDEIVKRKPNSEKIKNKRNTRQKGSGSLGVSRKNSIKVATDDKVNSDDDFDAKPSPKKSTTSSAPYRVKIIKGNFDLFLQKHKEEVKKEHPDQPDESIENFLRKQWEIMTDAQRARYRSHFGKHQEVTKSKSPGSAESRSANKSPRKRTSKSTPRAGEAECDKTPLSKKRHSKGSPNRRKIAANLSTPRRAGRECKSVAETGSVEADSLFPSTPRVSSEGFINGTKCENSDKDTPVTADFATDSFGSPKVLDALTDVSITEGVIHTPSSSGNQRPNGEVRVERICVVCEKPSELANDLIKCEGLCCSFFHVNCIGISKLPANGFKCEECNTGNRTCFACKEKAVDLRRCTVAHCGRFYHESCVQKNYLSRIEGKSLVCPLHVCVSCAASNPKNPWANKGKLFRCIRCPTAYHATDTCMGAGSSILTQGTMVCPSHYKLTQKHLNVNWCFLCSVGGSLLCCESCPAAFHVECLGIDSPEGSYFCADCVLGQQPKFGDIVWVKLGKYRWWPAEIQNPKSVPDNIQSIEHKFGEFPVFFFGSHDYYWTNRSRVYQYQEGDRGTKDGATKGLAKVFEAALQEAAEAYKALKQVRESREAQEQERINQRPPPYRQIKNNKPVGKVQLYSSDHREQNPCECDPNATSPCISDTDCLNRMLMIECDPAVCAAGENCCNQRFQKRQYMPTLPIRTEGKGWGLKTLADIKKGDFVIEYVGEIIDEEECRQRMSKMHEQQCTDFYFLTIDKDRIIDAGPKGNPARYMNHSCQPNCETQKWKINGDTRVGLFAITDIPAGTELTFNYNLDCLGNEKSQCCCGASNCSGYIGDRPKVTSTASIDKKSREASVKKRKKRKTMRYDKREHEDECFRCGEGGELVMCDKKSCSKAYHLSCLSLKKPPHGRWECPWHHCDVCGRPSVLLCAHCPNSFCQDHHEDLIHVKVGGVLLCYDHGSQPSEDAAKLLQLRSIAFQNMTAMAWNGTLHSTDCGPSTSTAVDLTVAGEVDESSPSKRRRGRSAKDSLPSLLENGTSDQIKEVPSDESLVKPVRGRPRKSSVIAELPVTPNVNGDGGKGVLLPASEASSVDSNLHDSEPVMHATSTKRNTRGSQKDQLLLPVNGNASPLKQAKKTSDSAPPAKVNGSGVLNDSDEDDVDFKLTSKQANLHVKPKKKQTPPKSPPAKNSTRVSDQRSSQSVARQRKAASVRNGKSVERVERRTRRHDIVVEERMAVLNGNLTVESVQPEVVTVKDESMDETTAIITVENLSGVGALDLKPYVQKYKLENGELSLEECEDSEIEMIEDSGRS